MIRSGSIRQILPDRLWSAPCRHAALRERMAHCRTAEYARATAAVERERLPGQFLSDLPLAAATTAIRLPARKFAAALAHWRHPAVPGQSGPVAGKFRPDASLNAGAGIAGQAARSPFPVGCLPVPDGTWTSAPRRPVSRECSHCVARSERRRSLLMLAPGAGVNVGLCRTARFDRRERLARCASTRCRQRRRQGVCRLSDGRSARFCGHEPIGSERRRVYRLRYECGLVVPPTPEHSPDAFLISSCFSDHN